MPFTPFDDQRFPVRAPRPTQNGYDTRSWDQYRQGVEIINDRFRFLGTQPKFWSGETTGFAEIATYGQTEGFIEGNAFALESKFKDTPKFDPVAYIAMGTNYPRPIEFNDGPQQQDDGSIEPLTIPFKKHSNEGPYYAHAIRGEVADGNNFDSYILRSSSRTEQFIDLAPPPESRFFLDEGGGYFGNVPIDGYKARIERKSIPFNETLPYNPREKLRTTNVTFLEIASKGGQTENGLLPAGKKSTCAGWSYYGLNAGQYGTDSIAFAGWSRGS